MNTKKCSKCGWEYPKEWPGRTCKFCHGTLLGGYCTVCGKWFDYLTNRRYRCIECCTKQHAEWTNNRKLTAKERYNDWIAMIKEIPIPYKTLTEQEWLETCKHFGGCAYCGAEQIDARAMFIKFKDGGRYCSWNIVPMCDKCAKVHDTLDNPFIHMDSTLNRVADGSIARKYNYDLDKLQKIVDYLIKKMEYSNDK